jgi:hypothetical protein
MVEVDTERKVAICPTERDENSALSVVRSAGYTVVGDVLKPEPEVFKYAAYFD